MSKDSLLDRIVSERGYLHPSREIIYKRDPKYLELYHQLFSHIIKKNSALTLKVKEMIILAINAVNNYEEGLRVHIKAAMDAGASSDEIFEAIETASLPGGIHTMTYSLPIFKEICEDYEHRNYK